MLGVEIDAAFADLAQSLEPNVFTTVSAKIDAFGTVRVRGGFAADRLLVYGTGGFAWARNTYEISIFNASSSASQVHMGWTAGGGAEYAFSPNWSVKAEYLYFDLASRDYFPAQLPSGALHFSTVKAGLNYRF